MIKYKIEEEVVYGIVAVCYVKVKKHWWSFWKYAKNKDGIILKYDNRRKAQAYINFRGNKK